MSTAELFDRAYRSIWIALHRPDDPDLSQHERDVLSHIPPEGCQLGYIVQHLGLPKSTCSEMVKGLSKRGFLRRVRDDADERRIQITLTAAGKARVADDRVLDQDRLARALKRLPANDRAALLRLMRAVADGAKSDRATAEGSSRSRS